MIKLVWPVLFVMMLMSGCGNNGTPTRHNDFTPLTSIQIVPAVQSIAISRTIAPKTSTRLTAIGNFSGLFTRDITDQVTWTSDTPAVAGFVTAAQPDRISGLTPGSAVLTATVGNVSGNLTLTVSPATIATLTLTPLTPSVPKGLSRQFALSGSFSDATTQDLTFDAAWTSSAPLVASVGDTSGNKGLAQALTVGSTTISALFDGTTASTLLTVTEPVLQAITVSPANPSVLSLSSTNFSATGSYSDGTTQNLTAQAAWTSSNTAIATIAAGGAATTLAQGTATISAAMSGVSGSTSLKVTGGTLTSITLSTPRIPLVNNIRTLVRGTTAQISATGVFSNGTTRDITRHVDWTTANTAIATVSTPAPRDSLAFLNAVATSPGITITATRGSISAVTTLAVSAPLLSSIAITPDILNQTAGTSDNLAVIATYGDASTQDVTLDATWSSVNTGIATVENTGIAKGRVTGVASGTTSITASFGTLAPVSRSVTVTQLTLRSLAITGVTTLAAGNQVKYTATATYTDNSTRDVTDKATWTSSNQSVAVPADNQNQPGQIVGVDSGSTTLTATFGGLSQTLTVTVP